MPVQEQDQLKFNFDEEVPQGEKTMTPPQPQAPYSPYGPPPMNYNVFTMEYYSRQQNTIVDALCCFLTFVCCASFCYPFSCFFNIFSCLLAKGDTSDNHLTRIFLLYLNGIALISYFLGVLFLIYWLVTANGEQDDDQYYVRGLYNHFGSAQSVSNTATKSLF
uniref:Uncharacterized protein n=1 Tax=Paramoeba aestuarina TaxID=180227 RepID=A0A7S4L141_9EUKA|eukprot:CAMPEP_0201520262 /NCGR_PEP_ID=MMETSP0161_2-20130828/10599_1 /ASSEMBLY_ACC=CAM_ASM_000251 /TAXON_ID=180227 /ORGANISM="Neoparamoeba aestuarina, Strain SoJaBio B1-5/56/2" /LENGTH=162 /DNA_ID=CAMNT_0047918569 /DNA_START=64 /DNA_END=552 /DNA_ORIENTATION=-